MCGMPSQSLDITAEEREEQARIFHEQNPSARESGDRGNVKFGQHLQTYVQTRDAARAKERDPAEIQAKAAAKASAERISRRRRMQASSLLASGAQGDTNLITGESAAKPTLGA